MFGFGKKSAHSAAMYSALIQVTCAYAGEYKKMPSEQTIINDVPALLNSFNAKVSPENMHALQNAAFVICCGIGDFDDIFLKIGGLAGLTEQKTNEIIVKLQKNAVFFF